MNQIASSCLRVDTQFSHACSPFIIEIFGVDTLNKRKVYGLFYEQYQELVAKLLQRHNKFSNNFEDLVARIWLDFAGSTHGPGLIDKFFAQAQESAPELPELMSAVEVAATLNIPWNMWRTAWEQRNTRAPQGMGCSTPDVPEFPSPVEGTYQERTSMYRRADIVEWYDEYECVRHMLAVPPKEGQWVWQVPAPRATKKHFIHYLKRAVQHRFANFCRTEERRHKERVWDSFPDQVSSVDNPASWEDRQETQPNQEEQAELGLLVRKLQRTPASQHLQVILMAMYDEHLSIYQAVEQCELMTEAEKRTTLRAVRGYRPGAFSGTLNY